MTAVPCVGDPEAWFSTRFKDVTAAREACFHCPRLVECAQDALDLRPTAGVWATVEMSEDVTTRTVQRRRLREIAAGRIPKLPKPIVTQINRHAIARLRGDGASVREIAEALHMPPRTVYGHLDEMKKESA